VAASESALVVLALMGVVRLDVANVLLRQLVDGLLDLQDAVGLPHGLGGEVAVGASAVPVSRHGLGVQGDHDAELLGDAVQKVPGDPQLVPGVDAFAGPNLELPLDDTDIIITALTASLFNNSKLELELQTWNFFYLFRSPSYSFSVSITEGTRGRSKVGTT